MPTDHDDAPGGPAATILLCFVTAMLEGADIISMGLAAPTVVRIFGFAPQQMAAILTAAIVGMMGGAVIGGRAGDRLGRRRVLLFALAAVAIFSLATTQAASFEGFMLARFLCGLGLGGALPNLIAIVAEASRPRARATSVSFMLAGQPVGGSLLGLLVAAQGTALDWRLVFFIGGALPLMILPALFLLLPESVAFLDASRRVPGEAARLGFAQALFSGGRGAITLLLWLSYGFTQVVVYLINNWLPTLMVAKGFGARDAALISALENMGAVAGCILLAIVVDRGRIRSVIMVTYAMMIVSLLALAASTSFAAVVVAGVLTGFFVVGGQLMLYTVAPAYYATLIRATGVGSAVSVGRLGAIAGPLAAGQLLALGLTPAAVLAAAAPCLLIAGAAVGRLVYGYRPATESATV
ncbi:MFS transporter [Sphingomonas sp. CL5.1]|uniref:MFS transporter n=1 Tax=Sphingomonas sp. CL5.1 TaxID=2653203 RepID=UPI001583397F|nr:MFS transporter [Sphingomonas sp. CL5.1]QKR99609.1 MFS transporter [Sphingomonas sp. CL5.1]